MTPTTPILGTIPVTGDNGLRGTLQPPATGGGGGGGGGAAATSLTVVLTDGRRVVVPAGLLQPQSDGSYYLPLGPADIATAAAATVVDPTPASVHTPTAARAADASVIPLVAEQVEFHKRPVETGKVRVTKSVEVQEQVVDVPLQREEVTVERVPVERFVSEVPPVRHEGDTMIVPVMEEVLVVEKRLMVREELRLTTRRTETHEPRTVMLRKEVAHVERFAAE